MGRMTTMWILCALVAAPACVQSTLFAQDTPYAQNFGSQPEAGRTLSNRPASLPTNNVDWPTARETSSQPPNRLTTPISTGEMTTTPAINPFHPPVQPAVPEAKTPIRRAADSSAAAETANDSEKPKPAEMLRAGAWNSGVAVVLLAMIGICTVVLLRKRHPQLTAGLPREVCDVLGRKRIDPRTSVCLVRLGSRILVLGTTGDSVTPLAEITDPIEIDQLAGLCKLNDSSGLPSFAGLLNRTLKPEPKKRGPQRRERVRDRSPDRSQEPADLPGLRGLKPGQKIDLTTP